VGILPFREKNGALQVYLAHFGGPFWKNKKRSWTIIKGEAEDDEKDLQTAKREFFEETGVKIDGEFIDLGEVKSSSKINHIYAIKSPDLTTQISSNKVKIEWPSGSGRFVEFPEVDQTAWIDMDKAKEIIVKSQVPFLDRLQDIILLQR